MSQIEVTTRAEAERGERHFVDLMPDDPRSSEPGWIEVTGHDSEEREFVRRLTAIGTA